MITYPGSNYSCMNQSMASVFCCQSSSYTIYHKWSKQPTRFVLCIGVRFTVNLPVFCDILIAFQLVSGSLNTSLVSWLGCFNWMVFNLILISEESIWIQGFHCQTSFWVWAEPVRDYITKLCCLSLPLAEPIPRMISDCVVFVSVDLVDGLVQHCARKT